MTHLELAIAAGVAALAIAGAVFAIARSRGSSSSTSSAAGPKPPADWTPGPALERGELVPAGLPPGWSGPYAPAPAIAILTPILEQLLDSVDRTTDAAMQWLASSDAWGPHNPGDCKNAAAIKRERIAAAGVPAGALVLATGRMLDDPGDWSRSHVWLRIKTDAGDFDLNNLQPIRPAAAAPYLDIAEEVPGSSQWQQVKGT